MTQYRFRLWSARTLYVVTAFSVLAFGSVETWALTVIEVAVFLLAILWMIRRMVSPFRLRWNAFVIPLGLVAGIACL